MTAIIVVRLIAIGLTDIAPRSTIFPLQETIDIGDDAFFRRERWVKTSEKALGSRSSRTLLVPLNWGIWSLIVVLRPE